MAGTAKTYPLAWVKGPASRSHCPGSCVQSQRRAEPLNARPSTFCPLTSCSPLDARRERP